MYDDADICNCRVGVVMDNGDEIRAPHVVSGAGVFNTYERLLPPEVG